MNFYWAVLLVQAITATDGQKMEVTAKDAYPTDMYTVGRNTFIGVKRPTTCNNSSVCLFQKIRYYIDKCVERSTNPWEDCYFDLFNSDYFWA